MSVRTNKRISIREPLKIWFWSLVFVLFLCVVSYGFLIRGMIVNIVERQSMENQLSSLNTKVLALESEYIKVKNSVTFELAHEMGFVPASNQKYVTRDTKNPGLSLVTPGF